MREDGDAGGGWAAFGLSAGLAAVNLLVFCVDLVVVMNAECRPDGSGDLVTPVVGLFLGHLFVSGLLLLPWRRTRLIGCGLMLGSTAAFVAAFATLWIAFMIDGPSS
jgi:hypothetical protein